MKQQERSPIQLAAMIFGVVFLVIGVAGFIPGLTTEYDRLDTFGDEGAKVLGLFGVNWLENLVHLAFGVAGFALAATAKRAWQFFIVGGVIYLVLWLYGLAIDIHGDANIIGVNEAGNWLHFAIFVAMIGVGLTLGRQVRAPA
jgi:uncharacterized protein DUF4383